MSKSINVVSNYTTDNWKLLNITSMIRPHRICTVIIALYIKWFSKSGFTIRRRPSLWRITRADKPSRILKVANNAKDVFLWWWWWHTKQGWCLLRLLFIDKRLNCHSMCFKLFRTLSYKFPSPVKNVSNCLMQIPWKTILSKQVSNNVSK